MQCLPYFVRKAWGVSPFYVKIKCLKEKHFMHIMNMPTIILKLDIITLSLFLRNKKQFYKLKSMNSKNQTFLN